MNKTIEILKKCFHRATPLLMVLCISFALVQFNSVYALQSSTEQSVTGDKAGFNFDRTLRIGMRGEDVRVLQKILNSDPKTRIAATGSNAPGNETAFFNAATKKALVAFHRKIIKSLPLSERLAFRRESGIAGQKTRSLMNQLLHKGILNTSPATIFFGHAAAPAPAAGAASRRGGGGGGRTAATVSTASTDSTAPVISAAGTGSMTATSITVTWTTDESADSQVQYGTTSSYGLSTTLDTTGRTAHSVVVTGLSAHTTYHYRILTRDGSGNLSVTSDATFTTGTAITDVAVSFGRLSASGVSVVTVAPELTPTTCAITAGNTGNYFTIDNLCRLKLASAGLGQITGTYSLSVLVTTSTFSETAAVTITTVTNRYDVSADAHVTEVLANSVGTLAGKTIAFHSGSYAYITISKAGLASTLTLVNAEATKPLIDSIRITGTSNVTLDGLRLYNSAWPASVSGIIYVTGTASNLIVQNSEIWHGYGSSHAAIDPEATYSEYTDPLNTMNDALAYAIARDGGGGVSDVTFQNNHVHDVSNGYKMSIDSGFVRVVGNKMERIYQDFVSIGASPPIDETTIAWNTFSEPFGNSTDEGNPHSDCIQLTGNDVTAPYTQANWNDINIYGNIFYTGNARGNCQLIFMDDMPLGSEVGNPVPRYFAPKITGNVLLTTATTHGIDIGEAADSYIFGNTVVRADPTNARNTSALASTIGGNSVGTENFAGGNIAESISGNANLVDLTSVSNVVTGLNGATIAYTTVFDGPSFQPTSSGQALTMFAPKSGGPAATGVKGAIGNGYVNFTTRTIDRTLEPSFVRFFSITGQAINTTVTSNYSLVRGGVAGRAISISGGEYQISSSSGGSVLTSWTSTAGTVDPGQYVQVRLTNSALGSTSTTATLTIGGSAYAFVSTTQSTASFTTVAFDGTTPDYLRKTGGLNAGTASITAAVSGGAVTGGSIVSGGTFYEPSVQNTLTFTGGGGSGAAGYATDTNADGILDSVTISAGGTGYSTAPTIAVGRNIQRMIFATRVKPGAITALDSLLHANTKLQVVMLSTNRVRFSLDSGNDVRVDTSSGLGFNGTSMQTMICSINLALAYADGFKCYIDSTSVAPGSPTTWGEGGTADVSNTALATLGLGSSNTGGANYWEGDMDFMYLAYGLAALDTVTGELPDVSSASIRSRFTADTIGLTNGTGPTGRQPQVFFTGAASVWNAGTNKGTGGDFIVNGAVQ